MLGNDQQAIEQRQNRRCGAKAQLVSRAIEIYLTHIRSAGGRKKIRSFPTFSAKKTWIQMNPNTAQIPPVYYGSTGVLKKGTKNKY